MDSEAETVMQLRNELRDKEMKLTDIRLEALSSAHQLDQLREAMNRMQVSPRLQGRSCSRLAPGPPLDSLLHFRVGPFTQGSALCLFLRQALSSPAAGSVSEVPSSESL